MKEENEGMGIMTVLIFVGLGVGWMVIVPQVIDAARTVSAAFESHPGLFWLGAIFLIVGLFFYKKNRK